MEVSVIVTAYNYASFLPNCLDSLLAQTVERHCHEIIVVDDNSQDDTLDCLEDYSNCPNLTIVQNPENLGVAGAANRGIELAKGRYFVRVDADDYVHPDFLRELVTPLRQNDELFGCACDYQLFDEAEESKSETGIRSARETPIACGVMYHRDRFLNIGGYNNEFRTYEHQELILRLADQPMHYLGQVLYYYRRHTQNQSKPSRWRSGFKQKLDALKSQTASR